MELLAAAIPKTTIGSTAVAGVVGDNSQGLM